MCLCLGQMARQSASSCIHRQKRATADSTVSIRPASSMRLRRRRPHLPTTDEAGHTSAVRTRQILAHRRRSGTYPETGLWEISFPIAPFRIVDGSPVYLPCTSLPRLCSFSPFCRFVKSISYVVSIPPRVSTPTLDRMFVGLLGTSRCDHDPRRV